MLNISASPLPSLNLPLYPLYVSLSLCRHPPYLLSFFFWDINPGSANKTDCALHYSPSNRTLPFGYSARAVTSRLIERVEIEEYMLSYKYLVVLAGIVSADRLNTFLAHSGAVILLQETDFLYHYSAFLEPWVHYGKISLHILNMNFLDTFFFKCLRERGSHLIHK